jgi:membrane associated rhomboid family serine protease
VSAGSDGFSLNVPPHEAERGAAVLAAYEAENPPILAAPRVGPLDSASLRSASLVSAALLGFFLWTGLHRNAPDWYERGSADAARILGGEYWRVVTALTLHADGPHVVGNALLGAVFFAVVFRTLGAGVGLACVLAAGALGNGINAAVRSEAHVSIGASTAVFGALGILAGLGLTRRLRLGLRGRRAFVPVAAGLGLLAMLGTAGERVDLWAHAFGLLAGVVLGVGAGGAWSRPPGRLCQVLAGGLAVAAPVGCWILALAGDPPTGPTP